MKIEIRAKATETFANADGDTVVQKIAPYCDAPQIATNGEAVTQRFDRASAQKLVGAFNSNIKRLLARVRFGSASLPVYNGHPDHGGNGDEEPTDTRVYAFVNNLEARDDGLWATIEKTPFLKSLKDTLGSLQISPRWDCVRNDDGTYRPERLLSLGLVTRGNLPGACLINSQRKDSEMNDPQIQQLAAIFGCEPTFDNLLAAANAAKPQEAVADSETATQEATAEAAPEATAATDEATAAEAPATTEETAKEETATEEAAPAEADPRDAKIAELEAKLAEATATAANAQKVQVDEIVKTALANGKIAPAQEAQTRALLSADFANAKSFIEALPISSVFSNGAQATAAAVHAMESEPVDDKRSAEKKYYDLVNEKLKAGLDLETAHRVVAGSRAGRELWNAFH